MRKRQNSKRVELGVAETPLGKGLEVQPFLREVIYVKESVCVKDL